MELTQQPGKIEGPNPLGPQTEKHKYVFPNILARMMKNVPMQVQFESSLMACSLILLGLILMAAYLFMFGDQTIAYKIILGINLIGCFIFMSSSLVTTFQQYQSYMDAMDFQKSMGMAQTPVQQVKKYNRKNQILFFGGLIIAILGLCAPSIITKYITSALSYRYYILGLLVLVGVLLMIVAIKKPKQKQAIVQHQRQTMRSPVSPAVAQKMVMRSPTAPPIQQTQSRPISRQPQQPVQQRVVQRPVQNRQIPAQRPIPTARQQVQPRPVSQSGSPSRPIQRQVQQQVQQPVRRVFRPQPQMRAVAPSEIPMQVPGMAYQQPVQKQGFLSKLKAMVARKKKPVIQNNLNIPIQRSNAPIQKPMSKKEKEMMDGIEKSLNKQLYDVNYMKAKERRY
jgi:hypothetical protein